MSSIPTNPKLGRRWTAEELRRLPAHQRDEVLMAAAKQAETDYLENRDLTDFEAFGKEDIHGRSSSAEPR